MLSAPHKNRKKRRRRKKGPPGVSANQQNDTPRSAQPPSTTKATSAAESPQSVLPEQPLFPQMNENFLCQEAEIETAMLLKKFGEESDVSKRKEYEIAFFTNSIGPDKFLTVDKEDEEQQEQIPQSDADIETHRDASMDILPTPSSVRTQYNDDGPQLAASYFHDDDKSIIEPYQSMPILYDENLLFLPDLVPAPIGPRDIETPTSTSEWHRRLADEGIFVNEKPELVNRNRAQMINRFIEENAIQWLETESKDIAYLITFLADKKSFKSDGGKKIRPILYPLTTVEASSATHALQDKVLKIQIQDIIFEQHPSYSKEQVLARKIEQLYLQYASRRQIDVVAGLRIKLDVIRKLITNSGNVPNPGGDSLRSASTEDGTIRGHKNELRDLRNRLHREEKMDRDIAQNLMQEWLALKQLRDKQGTQQTILRLIIKTREVDADEDDHEWNYRFNLELNEIFDEAMEFYRDERRAQKDEWSVRRKDDGDGGRDFEPIHKECRPDLEVIRSQLSDIYANSVRAPGEHIIDFELVKGASGTADIDQSKVRNDLTKYVIRLLLDDKEVGAVKATRMDINGRVHLNELFSIRLVTKIPDNIKIMIYEKQAFRYEYPIAELFPPIAFENELFNRASAIQMNFTSSAAKHSGKLTLIIGWASIDESHIHSKHGQLSIKPKGTEPKMRRIVQRWYDEHLIDPMDPDNNSLVKYIQSNDTEYGEGEITQIPAHTFRLNEDMTAFCSRDKLDNNKRLNLLTARFKSDLKVKNCRLVPHTEIEIEIPDDLKIFEDMLWVDPIDVQRYQGKKYLKHVYDIITNHCDTMNQDYTCHDLLVGDTPPTLLGVMEAISNIFSPRRPLHPKRKALGHRRFSKFPTVSHIDRFNIILNVVRASGIPYRTIDEHNLPRRVSVGSSFQIQRPVNVRPFISASFKDKTTRTSTVEGTSPTWNEQIVISVNEDINQIKSSLSILLFDEVIEDIVTNEDATSGNSIYQKVFNRFLGELIIPFSTIYTSQRIEGTFEMVTPHILLGYTKPSVALPDPNYLNVTGKLEIRQSILVSLLISIEPILHVTHSTTSHLECTELNNIRKHTRRWYEEMREEFPDRCQDPLVSLANGKRICITRLIGAIDIPFERGDASEYLIRRFVSLIPVRPHKNICTKLNGVWLTNDQILNTLVASPKDLGVLLVCYYLSLGYTAFLVLGYAIPYGDTTFVLTKETNEYYLIDPHSGKKYSSRDTFCPLTKVYCLANNENVWGNIQREHRVYMQSFDISFSTEWRELFSRSTPAPNELVHDLHLMYTDSLDHMNIRKTIELKLMRKLAMWRGTKKTVWNNQMKDVMVQVMKDLEEDRCFEYDPKNYLDNLNIGAIGKYKINGFPLNMSYVNVMRIVERVKATGIHIQTDDRVEFSIAVHIQPYPMNVFSVWVFILALSPKTS